MDNIFRLGFKEVVVEGLDYKAKDYGIKNDIAIKTFSKDAEWVGVFSTMRLPLERETSTISIDYNN